MSRHVHPAILGPRAWYEQRRAARGLILMYHSVDDVDVDPWGLFVTPRNFAAHLAAIREVATPVRLSALAAAQASSTLPSRAVVVTFDDGYVNNLLVALPILERYEVPATVFVVAGGVDSDREFWWDELEQMITGPSTLDGDLRLDAMTGPPRTFRIEASRRGRPLGPRAARMALYYRLWEYLSEMSPTQRDEALGAVSSWSGWTPRSRESHRPVRADELEALDRHPLIDIGAHTLTHPLLPLLAPEEQRYEVVEGAAVLERMLGHPVETFSYPFGAHDEVSVEAARSAGYQAACTTKALSVNVHSEVLRLPRMDVKDWSGRALRRRLTRWQLLQ